MYLLDTCVFSEFTKPLPSPTVLAWAGTVKESDQYLSALVLGELMRGVERMAESERRRALRSWIERLVESHYDRLIPIDAEVAREWAVLCATAETAGRTPAAIDSLIAAQARSRSLVLVTRNVQDFMYLGVNLFNPWD